MRKIYLLIALFASVFGYSQAITVDTNTHTVPQLVNDVLINSACVSATNINWRTGTNFGSANGIGYFQNTNPNFPIASGVILTTGNVMHAPGPNLTMLDEGSLAWLGDSSLETVLAASGITMNSVNATVLEFDFTPISSQFSFDFLFASEEYGNFQCQFSDAFAFLLTNLNTGVTTNLAVVPGTSTPISVVTIRDFLYNSTCNSQNPQFFGSFNGGSNASTSATNFNGQTKVMTASAVLTPNVPYHIKLVIADRSDYQSDSAIFLSSSSFNIGQEVLGENLLVTTNNAICEGENHVLNSGLDAALYTFQWKKDGVVLTGETGPTLTVNQPGSYELTYTNSTLSCQSISDTVTVEYYSTLVTPDPITINKCDTGQPLYVYNLSQNTPIVTAGLPAGSTATYYASLLDAQNNTSPLGTTVNSAGNQTIYVKITNGQTGCSVIKPFQLGLVALPTSPGPITVNACSDPNTAGSQWFIFSQITPMVLNGNPASDYTVTYYFSQSSALAGVNPFTSPSYFTSDTTIYAVMTLNTDTGCSVVIPVNLVVLPLPLVDTVESVITCDQYILPPLTNGTYHDAPNGGGTQLFPGDVITQTTTIYIYNTTTTTPSCSNQTNFNVTIIKPEELDQSVRNVCDGYTLTQLPFGDYFTQPGGGGTQLSVGTYLTTNQTVYMYYESITPPFCVIDLSFDVVVTQSPIVPTLPNVFDCVSYTLPPLSNGTYYDAPNGSGAVLAPGTVITNDQTVFIYAINGSCAVQTSFQVIIGTDFLGPVTECAHYTLPQLPIGNYYTQPNGGGTLLPAGTVISSTQDIYFYVPNASCTDNFFFTVTIVLPEIIVPTDLDNCGSYTLPTIPVGNYYTQSGGNGTLLMPGDTITTTQNLFIFVDNGNGCQNEVPITVTIYPLPIIDSRPDQTPCNSYTLTALTNGNYFTGPNGTGTQLQGGDVITTSQTIYIYATNALGCAAETSFMIDIFVITADVLPNVTMCDSYVLTALTTDNHYYTQPGGPHGTGAELIAGTVITSSQTIYIYKESAERINCFDESSFTVTLIPTPYVGNFSNIGACNSYTLPALSVGNYYTASGGTGNTIPAGTVLTTNQTLYVYAQTGTNPNCWDEKSFSVSIFNVDELNDVTTCESYVLPPLTIGNYYNGPNGTGGILPAGSVITTTKTVYVFAYSGFSPNCSDESSFEVTIINTPVANPVPISIRTLCDEDGTNDGIMAVNLSLFTSSVLGTQTGPEFTVAYYANLTDAQNGVNAIATSTETTVYVKVINTLAPNCYDIKPIAIIIHKIPEPTPKDGVVCIDSETGTLLNAYIIESGLPASTHTFQWFDQNGTLVGTQNNYTAVLAGTYSLLATNNATGCTSQELFTTVVASEPAIVAYAVSEDFSLNQTVTVTATGSGGDYEYAIDDNPFQDSPVFENVSMGVHTLIVRDKNGCGIASIQALILNYPKFFTPNGDGFHDTWNIDALRSQPDAVIYIYDRYGKLLKQIYPSGTGWDGNYNGRQMISDDYWFTVSYMNNQEQREFKAHFTLKR